MRTAPWEPNRQCYRKSTRPTWTADEWRTMERMRAAGVPVARIAKCLGRTPNAVSIAWWRYGPSPEYRRLQAFLRLVRRTVDKGLKLVHDDPEVLGVGR